MEEGRSAANKGRAPVGQAGMRALLGGGHHARTVPMMHQPTTHLLMSSDIFMHVLQPRRPSCVSAACGDGVSCCCCLLPEGGRPLTAMHDPPPDTLDAKKGLSYRIVADQRMSRAYRQKLPETSRAHNRGGHCYQRYGHPMQLDMEWPSCNAAVSRKTAGVGFVSLQNGLLIL